jgi:hypothetical protein
MTAFDAALAGFATLDEVALARPWSFREKRMDVRYALYRTLEDAQELLVSVAARAHPESRRILALAQRAFGDLRGLLIGLPDSLLDRTAREGEWPVRETLRHVLLVERRYAIQTRYAVERADSDPGGAGRDERVARPPRSACPDAPYPVDRIRYRRPLPSAPLCRPPDRAHRPVREDPRCPRMASNGGASDRAPVRDAARVLAAARRRATSRRGSQTASRRRSRPDVVGRAPRGSHEPHPE